MNQEEEDNFFERIRTRSNADGLRTTVATLRPRGLTGAGRVGVRLPGGSPSSSTRTRRGLAGQVQLQRAGRRVGRAGGRSGGCGDGGRAGGSASRVALSLREVSMRRL